MTRFDCIIRMLILVWALLWLGLLIIGIPKNKKEPINYNTLDAYIYFSNQYPKCTPLIYQSIVKHCANNSPVKPEWVLSLIYEESRFNPRALSHKGAAGLCQLMPNTAKQVKVKDVYNEDENIRGGVEYLKYCLKKSDGDLHTAFMRYHSGPNRKTFPQESFDYADRCISRIQALP